MTTHAIRIHKTGGPEVLTWEEIPLGKRGQDEVRLRHTAIGLNYIDTYHRSGFNPLPLPATLGMEAAGVVEEIGPGVADLKPGDRVVYGGGPIGAYAEMRNVAADRLVRLPASMPDQQAAAMMLKGMSAQYLIRRTFVVKRGDTILVHAAAGGIGLIMCQWAKHLGATVIVYTREDFVSRVNEFTGGKKLPVVYDSIGKDTFLRSLDCLQPLGLLVSVGQSAGPIGPIDLGILAEGSFYVTRPKLGTYTAKRADLVASATDLFDVVARGAVKIEVNQTYALKDVVQTHRDLQDRKTTGSTIFTV